jgi:hypothetical protein
MNVNGKLERKQEKGKIGQISLDGMTGERI